MRVLWLGIPPGMRIVCIDSVVTVSPDDVAVGSAAAAPSVVSLATEGGGLFTKWMTLPSTPNKLYKKSTSISTGKDYLGNH